MAKDNKEDSNKSKKNKNYDFKVVIWEDVGYSVREIKTIEAKRYVDEDKTPFIINQEENFMELYPQDMKDNVKLSEKEIKDKIKEIEAKIKAINNKKIEDYKENEPNIEDLKWDLRIMQAKERGLSFSQSASYVCFNSSGDVMFNFLRKGNRFYPFKWDTDTDHIYIPPEPVVKKAGILLRNKDNKYNPKKLIETSTLILLIIVIVGTLANLFGGAYLWKKYDDSNLAKLELSQVEAQNFCLESIKTQVRAIDKQINQTQTFLDGKTTTVIDGLKPLD